VPDFFEERRDWLWISLTFISKKKKEPQFWKLKKGSKLIRKKRRPWTKYWFLFSLNSIQKSNLIIEYITKDILHRNIYH
jgi:hypothetical protein